MDSSCSDPWWVGRWDSQLDSRALQLASAVPWYVVYHSCQSRRRRLNLLLSFDYCCWADFHPLIARDALEFHRVRVSCFSVFSLHRVSHRFHPNPSPTRWMRSWQERAVSAHRTHRWEIDFCLAIWWKYFSIRQTRRRDCRRLPVSLVWQKEKKENNLAQKRTEKRIHRFSYLLSISSHWSSKSSAASRLGHLWAITISRRRSHFGFLSMVPHFTGTQLSDFHTHSELISLPF